MKKSYSKIIEDKLYVERKMLSRSVFQGNMSQSSKYGFILSAYLLQYLVIFAIRVIAKVEMIFLFQGLKLTFATGLHAHSYYPFIFFMCKEALFQLMALFSTIIHAHLLILNKKFIFFLFVFLLDANFDFQYLIRLFTNSFEMSRSDNVSRNVSYSIIYLPLKQNSLAFQFFLLTVQTVCQTYDFFIHTHSKPIIDKQ